MKSFFIIFLICIASFSATATCDSTKVHFTVNSKASCDSNEAIIKNTSTLPLSRVAYFQWDFGDGSQIVGDSVTNVKFWEGLTGNGEFTKWYKTAGIFSVTLTVRDDSLCSYSVIKKSAVYNVTRPAGFTTTVNNNEVCVKLKGTYPISATSILWQFGDPHSGIDNVNLNVQPPCHIYSPGPYMISLRMTMGPCDFSWYDTVQIVGPKAAIEAPYNRIAIDEKYQCEPNDTVHFTNASVFYRNDSNPNDEDSVIMINGKKQFVFAYDTITHYGDQTSRASEQHLANRTMGAHIKRLWDFGDQYAQACTTSTVKGINVGKNCNYSEDEYPVHKYTSWDSIYQRFYHKKNAVFCELRYDSTSKIYRSFNVDTADSEKHYRIFLEKYVRPYRVKLWLKDTISGKQSIDEQDIIIGKPNASKMRLVPGAICPGIPGSSTGDLIFDLGTHSQSYFAVNYDSFSDPSAFIDFNSGSVLAPSSPGIPMSAIPYEGGGNFPSKFLKKYYSYEIGPHGYRSPEGSFSLGLIVGNGPLTNNKPECADTAWYHDMFRFKPLDPSFEIVEPKAAKVHLCDGDDIYFKIKNPGQHDITSFLFVWGNQYLRQGADGDEHRYKEEFTYFEPYKGPSPTRNDSFVQYSGEDWYYNYVIRTKTVKWETVVIDTIVFSIVKDWRTKLTAESEEFILNKLDSQECYAKLDPYQLADMLGKGFDTTGFGSNVSFKRVEYRSRNGDETVMRGDRRYRYLNAARTDSVEVAHVLHFRDSSLMGYDTLINGTDTIVGLYRHRYTYTTKDKDGKTVERSADGPKRPAVYLQNDQACQSGYFSDVTVGFFHEFSLNGQTNDTSILCKNSEVVLQDKIRYWQHGEEDPYRYPFDTTAYWRDPVRFFKLERVEYDWDDSDGKWDGEKTLNPKHTYDSAGFYTVTVAMRDSAGCRDTARLVLKIGEPDINFGIADSVEACNYAFVFSDSSSFEGAAFDRWNWDFGDGSVSTQNPAKHLYKDTGNFNIKLTAWTSDGCKGEKTKALKITQTMFVAPPPFTYSLNSQTLTTKNQSPAPNNTYEWDWGDATSKSAGYNASHFYIATGSFDLCLLRKVDSTNCKSDSCIRVDVGACNAKFSYSKGTSGQFLIALQNSSTGKNSSYLWNWGDGASSTGINPTHDYQTFGKFLISLRVSNANCISIFADSVGMDSTGKLLKKRAFGIRVDSLVRVHEFVKPEVQTYPNPTEEKVFVRMQKSAPLQGVFVFDKLGRVISFTEGQGDVTEIKLPETSGIYYLQIITHDQDVIWKKVFRSKSGL